MSYDPIRDYEHSHTQDRNSVSEFEVSPSLASGSEADDLWEFDTASLSSVGASDEGGEYDQSSTAVL